MLIVDTREQRPLWTPETHKSVIRMKLDEGDYTTKSLLNKAHIERKSPSDLYGSIIQGHTRFRKEIQRAIDKNIIFAIFVECPKEMFLRKRFVGGYRFKTPTSTLRKIISTMETKYDLKFVWCENRDDLGDKICEWLVNKDLEINGVN